MNSQKVNGKKYITVRPLLVYHLQHNPQGAQEGLKKAKIDDIINDIDFLNILRNLAFAFEIECRRFTLCQITLSSKTTCGSVRKAAQVRGSQKEGEVFEAQNTSIINLSILAFFKKNLPGLPVRNHLDMILPINLPFETLHVLIKFKRYSYKNLKFSLN